jgi:hypothetical protein
LDVVALIFNDTLVAAEVIQRRIGVEPVYAYLLGSE